MKNPKCAIVMIIGSVLLAIGCQKSSSSMVFERVDPDFGGLQGGKSVRIVGNNVRLDIGYSVLFGSDIASQVSIASDQAIVAVTPRALEPGRVDVVIRADDGSVFRINNGFEYVNQGGNLLDDASGGDDP